VRYVGTDAALAGTVLRLCKQRRRTSPDAPWAALEAEVWAGVDGMTVAGAGGSCCMADDSAAVLAHQSLVLSPHLPPGTIAPGAALVAVPPSLARDVLGASLRGRAGEAPPAHGLLLPDYLHPPPPVAAAPGRRFRTVSVEVKPKRGCWRRPHLSPLLESAARRAHPRDEGADPEGLGTPLYWMREAARSSLPLPAAGPEAGGWYDPRPFFHGGRKGAAGAASRTPLSPAASRPQEARRVGAAAMAAQLLASHCRERKRGQGRRERGGGLAARGVRDASGTCPQGRHARLWVGGAPSADAEAALLHLGGRRGG